MHHKRLQIFFPLLKENRVPSEHHRSSRMLIREALTLLKIKKPSLFSKITELVQRAFFYIILKPYVFLELEIHWNILRSEASSGIIWTIVYVRVHMEQLHLCFSISQTVHLCICSSTEILLIWIRPILCLLLFSLFFFFFLPQFQAGNKKKSNSFM